MQKRAERRRLNGLLADRDLAVSDRDGVDFEWRAVMSEPGTRNQLIGGGEICGRCRDFR